MTGITAKIIKTQLFKKHYDKNRHVVDSIYFHRFESDFIFVTNTVFINEIEIKVTKADFYKDFEKGFWRHKKYGYEYARSRIKEPKAKGMYDFIKKHDLLKAGELGIKGFYFAMPRSVSRQVEIPEHCGLITIHEISDTLKPHYRKSDHIKFNKPIIAPTLPNAVKITEKQEEQIATSIRWKYINDRKNENI